MKANRDPAAADRAEFQKVARTFRIRKPVRDVRGGTCGVGYGVCLEPLLSGPSRAWFDEELEPKHGDLVLVEYSDEWMERVRDAWKQESQEAYEAWIRSDCVDGVMPRLAAKILRIRKGVPWLLCAQYAVRLERVGRIVGVARHIEIDSVPVYGSGRRETPRRWPWHVAAAIFGALTVFQLIIHRGIYQ